jgi:hypothetical protein
MKKMILAFVALAFAFAISSCCDQSYCPQNMKCNDIPQGKKQEETPYRWDTQTERKHYEQQQERQQDKQRRRW